MKLENEPENLELLHFINQLLRLVDETPVNPEKWESQNIIFDIKEKFYSEMIKKSEAGDFDAAEWVKAFEELEDSANMVVE